MPPTPKKNETIVDQDMQNDVILHYGICIDDATNILAKLNQSVDVPYDVLIRMFMRNLNELINAPMPRQINNTEIKESRATTHYLSIISLESIQKLHSLVVQLLEKNSMSSNPFIQRTKQLRTRAAERMLQLISEHRMTKGQALCASAEECGYIKDSSEQAKKDHFMQLCEYLTNIVRSPQLREQPQSLVAALQVGRPLLDMSLSEDQAFDSLMAVLGTLNSEENSDREILYFYESVLKVHMPNVFSENQYEKLAKIFQCYYQSRFKRDKTFTEPARNICNAYVEALCKKIETEEEDAADSRRILKKLAELDWPLALEKYFYLLELRKDNMVNISSESKHATADSEALVKEYWHFKLKLFSSLWVLRGIDSGDLESIYHTCPIPEIAADAGFQFAQIDSKEKHIGLLARLAVVGHVGAIGMLAQHYNRQTGILEGGTYGRAMLMLFFSALNPQANIEKIKIKIELLKAKKSSLHEVAKFYLNCLASDGFSQVRVDYRQDPIKALLVFKPSLEKVHDSLKSLIADAKQDVKTVLADKVYELFCAQSLPQRQENLKEICQLGEKKAYARYELLIKTALLNRAYHVAFDVLNYGLLLSANTIEVANKFSLTKLVFAELVGGPFRQEDSFFKSAGVEEELDPDGSVEYLMEQLTWAGACALFNIARQVADVLVDNALVKLLRDSVANKLLNYVITDLNAGGILGAAKSPDIDLCHVFAANSATVKINYIKAVRDCALNMLLKRILNYEFDGIALLLAKSYLEEDGLVALLEVAEKIKNSFVTVDNKAKDSPSLALQHPENNEDMKRQLANAAVHLYKNMLLERTPKTTGKYSHHHMLKIIKHYYASPFKGMDVKTIEEKASADNKPQNIQSLLDGYADYLKIQIGKNPMTADGLRAISSELVKLRTEIVCSSEEKSHVLVEVNTSALQDRARPQAEVISGVPAFWSQPAPSSVSTTVQLPILDVNKEMKSTEKDSANTAVPRPPGAS